MSTDSLQLIRLRLVSIPILSSRNGISVAFLTMALVTLFLLSRHYAKGILNAMSFRGAHVSGK